MSNPSVKHIVAAELQKLGYDGLYADGCGCSIEDLMPCDADDISCCQAGYKRPAEPDECERIWQAGDWMIGPTKQKGGG